MLTAVVSDLHLGTRSRDDLLRRPQVLARLLEALDGVDQLVLLGDAIELRDRPVGQALAAARPLLEGLRDVLPGGRVVLVPGNHDHRLSVDALGRERWPPRGLAEQAGPQGSRALVAIQEMLGAVELVVSYPGFWISADVFALHGHYLDVHSLSPTLECFASAVLARRAPHTLARPADYELRLRPTYELFYAIAQRRRLQRLADGGKAAVRAAEAALGVREAPAAVADGAAAHGAFAGVLGRLDGRERHGAAPGEGRRPGVEPIAAVISALGIEAAHVLFGHTHRAGRIEAALAPRLLGGRTSLTNTGSWMFEPRYLDDGPASAYWPGALTLVGAGGVPEQRRLLAEADLGGVRGAGDQRSVTDL